MPVEVAFCQSEWFSIDSLEDTADRPLRHRFITCRRKCGVAQGGGPGWLGGWYTPLVAA